MDPLPHLPRTLRDFAEADLRRAARLIITVQDELDWQLRIATEKFQDWHLAITMPDDAGERRALLANLQAFMFWKDTCAFTLATELREPDALYTLAISRYAACHCLSRIKRQPRPWTAANFGPIEWLPDEAIDPELSALAVYTIDKPDIFGREAQKLEALFGQHGKFPSARIGTLVSPAEFRKWAYAGDLH